MYMAESSAMSRVPNTRVGCKRKTAESKEECFDFRPDGSGWPLRPSLCSGTVPKVHKILFGFAIAF